MGEAKVGCACGARWGGSVTCHCGSCHRTFTGVTAFDRHRRRNGTGKRVCFSPQDAKVSLVALNRDGYTVWGIPGDESNTARLQELKSRRRRDHT